MNALPAPPGQRLSPQTERYLLCRPHGGLNDTLCQIEKCWKYALKSDRVLIIDTRNSGLHADFSEYFEAKEKSLRFIFDTHPETLEFLNQLSCFPFELRGKLHCMDLATYRKPNLVLENNPRVQLTFNFSKEYEETVLVHEQYGGGTLSFDLLEKIYIAPNVRVLVLERIAHLNGNYCAVHVRNTDLKTNYESLFRRILPETKNRRVLVCSDDAAVIEYARLYFPSGILTSSEIPDTRGAALHYSADRKKHAIDAIVDLIALGKAEKLYFSVHAKGGVSGFSRLAAHLSQNKYVIENLLQLPVSRPLLTKWRITLRRKQLKEYLQRAYYKMRYSKYLSSANYAKSRSIAAAPH